VLVYNISIKRGTVMLDDLKFIHDKDGQDALGVAEKQYEQLGIEMPSLDLSADYDNVVFAGMGGSALAASMATTWPGVSVPFEIVRGYDVPGYISENTLFIASSYSGNTEETIEALGKAYKSTNHIVCITRGGKLSEIANEKGHQVIILPEFSQPRFAALASLLALTNILESATVAKADNAVETLRASAEDLKTAIAGWIPTVATKDNPAKKLAQELIGKTPVIYGGPLMFPAAYKWKISINENAKNVAWCGQLPEFNHNEFLGWSSHPTDKPYEIIDLRSSLEHERVQKRFLVSDKLLSGRRPKAHVVQAEGETILTQLLWTVAYGDFVSLYLALLNGLNPTPVDLIEKFKIELVK
jgi:glucose/mannose-6-phosphate isomerase